MKVLYLVFSATLAAMATMKAEALEKERDYELEEDDDEFDDEEEQEELLDEDAIYQLELQAHEEKANKPKPGDEQFIEDVYEDEFEDEEEDEEETEEVGKLRHRKLPKGAKGVKKLYHVQTGKCLDFLGTSSYGRLVGCAGTRTKVKKEKGYAKGINRFKIYHRNGSQPLSQDGKYLDAVIEGAYPFDGSREQQWVMHYRGGGVYSLQDTNNYEWLDDWHNIGLDMDSYNPTCTCQHWRFI